MNMLGVKVPWRKRRFYKYAVLARMETNIMGEHVLTVVPPNSYIELPQGEQYIVVLTADPTFTATMDGHGN